MKAAALALCLALACSRHEPGPRGVVLQVYGCYRDHMCSVVIETPSGVRFRCLVDGFVLPGETITCQ